MRIGAHVDFNDPLAEAASRKAEVVQFFLSDPQKWEEPKPRPDAAALRDSDVQIFVHAPYRINVAAGNNRIRIPSRKLMLAHAIGAAEIGASGLIVHGGHVDAESDRQKGFDNWRKAMLSVQEHEGPKAQILIENTAGGDFACARRFDAIGRLWDAIGDLGVGFCLDTCHAHAGGEDLLDIVDRVLAITGRIDLVHANGSRDGFDSGRDRHDNLTSTTREAGMIDPELVAAVVSAAGAPAVVETPNGAEAQAADIAFLRAHG
jgi:deoxyribonuclease IV